MTITTTTRKTQVMCLTEVAVPADPMMWIWTAHPPNSTTTTTTTSQPPLTLTSTTTTKPKPPPDTTTTTWNETSGELAYRGNGFVCQGNEDNHGVHEHDGYRLNEPECEDPGHEYKEGMEYKGASEHRNHLNEVRDPISHLSLHPTTPYDKPIPPPVSCTPSHLTHLIYPSISSTRSCLTCLTYPISPNILFILLIPFRPSVT